MSHGILVSIKPIDGQKPAQIILQQDDARATINLPANQPITITPDSSTKYCTGWHDISTHTGHTCEHNSIVDTKHEQCYPCRQKTDFNPAFYNTTDISDKQAAYNNSPHSVYVAYFGGGLAKAGISADSRGLRRLREQGALLYTIIDSFPNAEIAHHHEDRLIAAGLRNGVSRRQKSRALEQALDLSREINQLESILGSVGQAEGSKITNQLDDYFYGSYPAIKITPNHAVAISGTIRGVVGRYLVLENNDRLYGTWLDSLLGYRLNITNDITPIEAAPEQVSLF